MAEQTWHFQQSLKNKRVTDNEAAYRQWLPKRVVPDDWLVGVEEETLDLSTFNF